MIRPLVIISFIISNLALQSGCKQINKLVDNREGVLLAEVSDKKLYMEDIEGVTAGASNPDDSLLLLRAYVNNWIKDQLLITEAESKKSQDLDIDRLVKDYKSSLVLADYIENVLINELDTMVSQDQRKEYYDKNREQFTLGESIIKFEFAKVDDINKSSLQTIDKLWNRGKHDDAMSNAMSIAIFQQKTDEWVSANALLSLLPNGMLNENAISQGQKIRKEDKDHKFYVKILDYHKKGEAPPLEYLEAKIQAIILNERKTELVKTKKQLLYKQYANTSKSKSYVD
jgi:hypothetical protein